jgi:hypothetical protein
MSLIQIHLNNGFSRQKRQSAILILLSTAAKHPKPFGSFLCGFEPFIPARISTNPSVTLSPERLAGNPKAKQPDAKLYPSYATIPQDLNL